MNTARRPTISILIITLNEERMLGTVLESVAWADEIVVVDSGSTDRTEEIARRFTDEFHPRKYEGHGLQRQHSLELSSGEWIFYVDADEVVTPELRDSLLAAISAPGSNVGFRMQLHTRFLGQWFGKRGWRREWKTRVFRRGHGSFSDARIHEGAVIDGPVGTLRGPLLHYPYRDLAHFAEKMNLYSSGVAADLTDRGVRGSAFGAAVRGVLRFLRDYIFGGEFLYGGAGLVRSTLFGYYVFLKYAKLYEKQATDSAAVPDPLPRPPLSDP